MLVNNIQKSAWFDYDIQFNPSDSKWYAWYLNVKKEENIKLLNEGEKDA